MNQLNTLFVNSSKQDYANTQEMLAALKSWQVNLEWESTYESALTKIENSPYDLCLLNYHSDNSFAFLRRVAENRYTPPLILMLDSEDEILASRALEAGAADYLIRDQINTSVLERSLRYVVKIKQLTENLQVRLKQQITQLISVNKKLRLEVEQYKQTEKTLRTRERQYRMFFNLDVYGVEMLDTKGLVVNCNTTYESLLGYTRKEIIGQHSTKFVSESSQKHFEKKLVKLEKRGYIEGEVELIRKDGTILTLWQRHRAIYDDNGVWVGIVVYNRDITERMKAVKQISNLARALEQSPVAFMITNEVGNIEYINFKFTELTEYDYEEMLGQNLHTIQAESLSTQEYEEMWQAVTAGEEWHSDLRNQKKGGEEYWESVTITPMFDTKGKITNFIVTKEDITQRRFTETESLQSQHRMGNLMSEHISDLTSANEALEHEIADRKRIETTLRRSRARLKAQYKGIPMPTYSWQKAGNNFILVDYNDAAERDSHGRIADFMGKPAKEVFAGKKGILSDFERCFDQKTMVKREAPYQLVTTGEDKFFVTTYNFVPPNLVVVHIEDITHFRQIEDELKKHKEQLELLSHQQAQDLVETKAVLEHEVVEHGHDQETLYKAEEELKKVSNALQHELVEHEHQQEILHEVEVRIKEITANIDDRLREQYRTIPIPAYSWQSIGGQFILVDFNDAAAESMGRIVDFLGKPASEVFKDRPQVLEDFDTCYQEQRSVKREAPYQMVTTGEHKFFKTTYDFIVPNLVIVHIEDITQYKQMEMELNEYRSQFETISANHKTELAKRNEAVRREIHKRKQSQHTLNQVKAKYKNQVESQIKALNNKYITELNQRQDALQQERVKQQEAEKTLKKLQHQIEQHHDNLENTVKERTAELSKINEQLQQEIVEHQRAEDSLREARIRLKAQYKGIPVPTYSWQIVGNDFILIDYNNAAERISQGAIADLMGKSAKDVFKDRSQVLNDFNRCFNRKKTVKRAAPYKLLRTGETKHFVTTYNFVPPNLIIVYIEDVTEYKQTEKALHESEIHIELLCRYSPDLKLTFVNNVYCWYFNKHRDDLLGQELPFIHEQDIAKVKKLVATLTPQNPVEVIEYRIVKSSGTTRRQQWIYHATFGNRGRLIEIQAVGRDIADDQETNNS